MTGFLSLAMGVALAVCGILAAPVVEAAAFPEAMAGVDIVPVPYRGGAQSQPALWNNEVQMLIDPLPSSKSMTASGRVRALAVTSWGYAGRIQEEGERHSTVGFTTQYAAMLIASSTCDMVACVYGRNVPGSMHDFSGVSVYDLDCGLVNANACSPWAGAGTWQGTERAKKRSAMWRSRPTSMPR